MTNVFMQTRSIADEDAPKITDRFYKHMCRNHREPINASEAALALHIAVQKLRESGVAPSHWVPFVHYGL